MGEHLNMDAPRILASGKALQTLIEFSFIQQRLLGNEPVSVEDTDLSLRERTIIYIDNGALAMSRINRLLENNNRLILIHMGDETGKHFDQSIYSRCTAVCRNYFFQFIFDDMIAGDRVFWFPNGYRNGVGPRDASLIRRASQRRRLAMFSGWLDNNAAAGNERACFRAAVQKAYDLIAVHETEGFASGFAPPLYASLMENSIFAPCPGGNNYETIRLYDSLEVGCIPIVTQHEYLQDRRVFTVSPPFPVINSWDELPDLIADLNAVRESRPDVIDELQLACIAWWAQEKRAVDLLLPRVITQLAKRSDPGVENIA
jgi:hypothetical protein